MLIRNLFFSLLLLTTAVQAESKRIVVHELGQHFWEVKRGDTLSEIISTISPGSASERGKLIQQIVDNNPQAFINNNPDKLIAGTKLWFDRAIPARTASNNQHEYSVQKFSWGSIKRLKE